ncbi:MAG: TonB family protein [bacterium]
MNILGKTQEQEDLNEEFELPAVLREDTENVPLEKALIISAIFHPVLIILFWLLFKIFIFLLAILGITLPLVNKPHPKMRDIEFVLVDKPEEKPINPNTKYRSDKNSRAGGKHDPDKPISDPQPRALQSKSNPAPRQDTPPKTISKPVQHVTKQAQAEAPKVPPRPMLQQNSSQPKITQPKAFSIPAPAVKAPKAFFPSGGPVTSGPIGESSPSSSPAPVMSSDGNSGRFAKKSNNSGGYSLGGGQAGNPSPGNPSGRPGIDAIKEPDFGAYMAELQRRIKRNWEPPRGNESKRVVLLFKVSKSGRLINLRVQRSSGNPDADKAAISAVELAEPFRPLPPEYKGNDIDIEFTFDYNVLGIGSRYLNK